MDFALQGHLLSGRLCDFLKTAHVGRPDDIRPLTRAISKLEDVIHVSQISLCESGEFPRTISIYKKFDTVMLNSPDWEYTENMYANRMVSVRFWKNGSYQFTEADYANLECLAHFIILYTNGMHFVSDAMSASVHDASSGLANVTGFTNAVQNLINLEVEHNYSILYISTSKFQLVDRKYGYDIADKIKLTAFKRLKAFTISQQPEQVVARLSNADLGVIVRNDNLDKYLEHLSEMDLSITYDGGKIVEKADFKIGIYQMEKEYDASLPINYAMIANGIAAQSGLTNVTYFTDKIKNSILREKEIESRMRDALDNDEFAVYYQPKIDIVNNCLIGAEALVRWVDGDMVIAPGDFVPIFEKNGFICQLDFYVLESVLKRMRKWLDDGLSIVKTSVNFSRVHLSDISFTKRIIKMLRDYRIPAKYIEIEFTETGDTDAAPMLADAIQSLKDYGIATAMDDFGSGYSSLSLLTSLSFDVLKLDKSFLEEGTVSDKEKVVINNVIRMVQDLNIDVIMEGVETPEQVEFLRKVNCNMAQGYIFDKPLPVEMFEKRLLNKYYPKELTA